MQMLKLLLGLVFINIAIASLPFIVNAIESSDYVLDSYSFGNFADKELESSDYGVLLNSNLFNGEISTQSSQNNGSSGGGNSVSNSGLQFISVGSTTPVSYLAPLSYTGSTGKNKPTTSNNGGTTTSNSTETKQDSSTILSTLTSWYCVIPILIILLLIILYLLVRRKDEDKNHTWYN